jgi:hypothetical protein
MRGATNRFSTTALAQKVLIYSRRCLGELDLFTHRLVAVADFFSEDLGGPSPFQILILSGIGITYDFGTPCLGGFPFPSEK